MADTQISATGGDVTEQTSIQIRRGSTVTDSPPVEDDVDQFSAHEGEELDGDPLHYEDPVMHISGAGHWFLDISASAVRDQYLLYQRDRAHMAGCCWQCMYDGSLDY